jgi:hypothetical protein
MTEKRIFGGTIRSALIHAATRYDVRQSKGKRYNHYALPQYFARIDEICADIERGADPRAAIAAAFTGSLLNAMLKAIDATPATRDELTGLGKAWSYQPVISEGETVAAKALLAQFAANNPDRD